MEPNLKPQSREPLILKLSSLEKVVEELQIERSNNTFVNAKEKVKINRELKKDGALKCFEETQGDEKSFYSEVSNSKILTCNTECSQANDDGSETVQVEDKNDTLDTNAECSQCKDDGSDPVEVICYLSGLVTSDLENVPEKTGLDKLVPYHIFNGINPDILIKINGAEFGVHRPLLKLYTSFFEEAIAKLDECIITLPEKKISMEIFHAIYSWMLHDGEDAISFIDRKNLANIFVAAKYLKITDLIETCKAILESKELFNEMTAFSLFMEAYNLNDKDMQIMMIPRIQSVFLHIVSSSLFENLPIEIILMLISSDFIKAHSELEVFYAAIKWLLNDWPTRSYHANRVMNQIRFALLKPSQLVDLKRCPDAPMIKFITNGKDILKLIDDGIALSVKLESYGNSPKALKEECDKLGLTFPAQRCWFEEQVQHQTYDEFLQSLDIIRKQHHYA